MKLSYVEIENFRSIKKETIDFSTYPCRIIIGVNESGKSNILRAVGAISKTYNIQISAPEDKRIPPVNESFSKKHEIMFKFFLDDDEKQKFHDKLKLNFCCKNIEKTKIFENIEKKSKLTLMEMIAAESHGSMLIDLLGLTKNAQSNGFRTDNYNILSDWKKIPPALPHIVLDGKNTAKGNIKYINIKDYPDQKDSFQDVDIREIENLFDTELCSIIETNLPEVIFWSSLKDQSFHADINIQNFINNPDTYPHFKSMCLLVKNDFPTEAAISQVFTEKLKINQLGQLYKKIENETSKYLKRIWDDFNKEKIKIDASRGNNIVSLSIEHKDENGNPIPTAARSDGFKKFLNLMLSLSLKVDYNEITNALIIIDEAEVFLHTHAAECFRDELIKLSTKGNNRVIFSTHSPFMIDGNHIDRHIIVEKEKETTSTSDGEEGKYFAEELLWQAVGCGIIKALAPQSLIFEGWDDKELYTAGLKKLSKTEQDLLKPGPTSKMSVACAGGAAHIRNCVPAFQAGNSKVFVLCDSDTAGKAEQTHFKNTKLWGHDNFYTFVDLGGLDNATAEDYLTTEKINKGVAAIKKEYNFKDEPDFTGKDIRIMDRIKTWLDKDKNLNNDTTNEVIRHLKDLFFSGLKKEDIKDDFKTVLVNLSKKLKEKNK